MTENTRRLLGGSRIDTFEHVLDRWLFLQVQAGVSELVLVGILRDYADVIERRGVIPRSWGEVSLERLQPVGRPPCR